MARVTVEDCVTLVPNRFELVMMAAQRARDIHAGAPMQVAKDNDKTPVISLREIAEEKIDLPALKESLISGHQMKFDQDLPEDDIIELMAGEQGWINQAGASQDDVADGFGDGEDEGDDEDLGADEESEGGADDVFAGASDDEE